MFGLGSSELAVVIILALIFIGPDKLPQIATTIGKTARKLREAINDLKTEIK